MTEPIRIELPTLYGMKSVNAYLFLEPEPVLIDCGEKTTATWEALQSALAVYNLKVKDLKKVIITHAHVDHIGMAGKIAAESEAEIWVNDYTYDWAIDTEKMWNHRINLIETQLLKDVPPNGEGATFKNMLLSFMGSVSLAWTPVPPERVRRFPMKGVLSFGGADWEIIYAPGHSKTQTCFYQKEQKWLIAADMLLRITPTPVIDFDRANPTKRENNLAVMLESYEKMSAMDIRKVFPGHYEPFGEHLKLIESQVRRIQMRKETTLQLIKDGKYRFYELFDILYANRLSMPGMSMLRGYLDLLIAEKHIEERIEDGFTAYFPL